MITGRLTTTAPLHIGGGEITTHPDIRDDQSVECDIQAVVKDHQGRPCIPGTALKGVLRAWAERFFRRHPKKEKEIQEVFGSRNADGTGATAGKADFLNAFVVNPSRQDLDRFAKHLPYWREASLTAVASHVCIDRHTGAARANKLYFEEFVPEGVSFLLEIDDARLSSDAKNFLHAVLTNGAEHDSHPYQFGANGADGWGRARWTSDSAPQPANFKPDEPTGFLQFTLKLAIQGPFLVNDASRDKRLREEAGRTNFTPLRRADGTVWLPASSFRGALRQRAEFLLRSADPKATGDPNSLEVNVNGPIETLFGHEGRIARLTIAEFQQIDERAMAGLTTAEFQQDGERSFRHQDFVAIDRFTGGAAEGAKFDATYADRPTFWTKFRLDTNGLAPDAQKLLAAALRDVCRGEAPIGFGGSKGYGVASGTLCDAGISWSQEQLALAAQTDSEPTSTAPPAGLTLIHDTMVVVGKQDLTAQPFRYLDKTGGRSGKSLKNNQLSLDLQQVRIKTRIGDELRIEVEYELEDGQPVRVRKKGEPYASAEIQTDNTVEQPIPNGWFIHPYYFLSMADRKGFTGELADREPVGHLRHQEGYYSGVIRVRLTTETPLLLLDTDQKQEDDDPSVHKTYQPLTEADGKPLLASSSARGMLRAAFEAITNSRFGVFPFDLKKSTGHARKLGLRTPAQSGLTTIPVRIEKHNETLRARLLPGLTTLGRDGKPMDREPMCAAWIAMYDRNWVVPNVSVLRHGDNGWAYVRPWRHDRGFTFWNVEEIKLGANQPTHHPSQFRPDRLRAKHEGWGNSMWVQGWCCITERNIDGKHDERFFFDMGEPLYAALDPNVETDYAQLIQDYQQTHVEELKRGITRPTALKAYCRFSRQITHDLRTVAESEQTLAEGALAYASLRRDGDAYHVTALYPVMISRKLHQRSPHDLLPPKLRPAMTRAELSPADRVFGWVRASEGKTRGDAPAYRSQTRVGPVDCKTPDAIHHFDSPAPLAILGQPKPAQGRFYLGKVDDQGRAIALADGISKEQAGYVEVNRVRGPKVYPRHKNFNEQDGHWRAKPGPNQRSSQNRSIKGWVKKDVVFEFDLSVTNLSRFELGALLWLLQLPDGCFLRLGLGKPLGFGSVKAEVVPEGTRLADGKDWVKAVYKTDPPADSVDREAMIEAFQETINKNDTDLLRAFSRAARGWDHTIIHYPPAQPGQRQAGADGGGEHYQWFSANERISNKVCGLRKALPDLTANSDPFLPDDPTREQNDAHQGRSSGPGNRPVPRRSG